MRTVAPQRREAHIRAGAGRPAPPVPVSPRGRGLTPAAALQLQRTAGNAAVGRLLARDGPLDMRAPKPRAPRTVLDLALGNELADKVEKMATDVKLSTRNQAGHDMRFSLIRESELKLPGYFSLTSKYELSPDQLRIQWGEVTQGYRIDSWSGLKFGGPDWSIEALVRNTYASGSISPVEHQQVGAVRLTMGYFQAEYYNDHYFPVFPMGGGTDQGDTAGLSLRGRDLGVRLGDTWRLDEVSANLRLATGIPDQTEGRTSQVDGHTFYDNVAFDQVRQGLLSLGVTLRRPDIGLSLKLEGGLNADYIRDATQNEMIHHPMKIPEFRNRDKVQPFFGLTLTKEF